MSEDDPKSGGDDQPTGRPDVWRFGAPPEDPVYRSTSSNSSDTVQVDNRVTMGSSTVGSAGAATAAPVPHKFVPNRKSNANARNYRRGFDARMYVFAWRSGWVPHLP